MEGRAGWAVGLALCLFTGARPGAADGQIISPGKLSGAHAEWDGIRSCTRCHELRKPGVSNTLCLECHTPLRTRIAARRGYHATVADQGCAECHKDHFGEDFALVRLDTLAFDHSDTGYDLEGAHESTGCRSCHVPERVADVDVVEFKEPRGALSHTFLGLPTTCEACHAQDDPHGSQFEGRECTECHDTSGWEEAGGFDHSRTRYPLTGLHVQVTCEECHAPARPGGQGAGRGALVFKPLSFGTCQACHADPHRGAMEGACTRCHSTAGWKRVDPSAVEGRFNHRSTGFDLVGRHASAPCASCHDARARTRPAGIHLAFDRSTLGDPFPRPEAGSCLACHDDAHAGEFHEAGRASDCLECHDQTLWVPSAYGITRHNQDSPFVLDGAHLVVECSGCHTTPERPRTFVVDHSSCASCHAETDPHGEQFSGRACDECHTTSSFSIRTFDHATTAYPLDGAHATVECGACHTSAIVPDGRTVVRYRPLGMECRDCHGARP
ncbi:MAG: cytochrome c3 family protein [Gemmatimonadota bacterium]|nr:cytochrome c3 family protein [Gemmatimonadota bacterium]